MGCDCTSDEWAVRLEGDLGSTPSPHLLEPGDEAAAWRRAYRWREKHPELTVTVLRKSRWVQAGEWEVVS